MWLESCFGRAVGSGVEILLDISARIVDSVASWPVFILISSQKQAVNCGNSNPMTCAPPGLNVSVLSGANCISLPASGTLTRLWYGTMFLQRWRDEVR